MREYIEGENARGNRGAHYFKNIGEADFRPHAGHIGMACFRYQWHQPIERWRRRGA